MDISLSPQGQIVNETAVGLAGSTINGSLVSANSTEFSVNSSEHDFFDFGESCKVTNLNFYLITVISVVYICWFTFRMACLNFSKVKRN